MTSITRRVQKAVLAAGVFGALGFGAAAAVAAPPAEAEPFFCGQRISAQACANCCNFFGYTSGFWNSENGACWCFQPAG